MLHSLYKANFDKKMMVNEVGLYSSEFEKKKFERVYKFPLYTLIYRQI